MATKPMHTVKGYIVPDIKITKSILWFKIYVTESPEIFKAVYYFYS